MSTWKLVSINDMSATIAQGFGDRSAAIDYVVQHGLEETAVPIPDNSEIVVFAAAPVIEHKMKKAKAKKHKEEAVMQTTKVSNHIRPEYVQAVVLGAIYDRIDKKKTPVGMIADERAVKEIILMADLQFFQYNKFVEGVNFLINNGFRIDLANNPAVDMITVEYYRTNCFPLRYQSIHSYADRPIFKINLSSKFHYDNCMKAFFNEIRNGIVIMKAQKPDPKVAAEKQRVFEVNKAFNKYEKGSYSKLMEIAHITKRK